MAVEGCALQILRSCGVPQQQLLVLLQPFGGQLPTTDAQLQELFTNLRRHGHIMEGVRGNISSVVNGQYHQARAGQYYGEAESFFLNFGNDNSATPVGGPLMDLWAVDDPNINGSRSADVDIHWTYHGNASGSGSADASMQQWSYPVHSLDTFFDDCYSSEDDYNSSDTSSDDGIQQTDNLLILI